MRVLFLTKYSRMGASSRYRSFQYFPLLEAEGISCEVSPLFPNEYLAARYRDGRPSVHYVLNALWRRWRRRKEFRTYDFVVIEKELFPYLPVIIDKWALKKVHAYSLDFDDALFHIYEEHSNPLVRKFISKKHFALMQNAAVVTVGNPYIAEYANKYSRYVEMLPTVIDMTKYPFSFEPKDTYTVGWIGTPNTAKYLYQIKEVLKKFFRVHTGRLLLIGANKDFRMEGVPCEIFSWSEKEETSLLQQINVGIMPLPDRPLENGKSALKILQYMACGRPVIASPVGVNSAIVNNEVGFLAASESEWYTCLVKFARNPQMRKQMGAMGRTLVEQRYSLDLWAKKYANILKTAFERSNKPRKGSLS